MPYSQTTLAQARSAIASRLDDINLRYWRLEEINFAIWEALRVYGALTGFWSERGSISLAAGTPYYDLSVELPTLRPRAWTLNQITLEIQYALLEIPVGISGAQMSGQVSITSILNAIARARNRFVLDARLPVTSHTIVSGPPPPEGLVNFPQTSVFVHRAAWMTLPGGAWTNLWRSDEWEIDKNDPLWTLTPGIAGPQVYSEASLSPLRLQLAPQPLSEGQVEIISVDSLALDLTNPAASLQIPDEWSHAIKWAALADLLTSEAQISDPERAQYALSRYAQAVSFAQDAKSLMRLMVANVPVPVDTFAGLDAANPFWRNSSGPPGAAGVMYDFLILPPPDRLYGSTVDIITAAPLPLADSDFIQLGFEDIENLVDYAVHILSFKSGGDEFKATFALYDRFMAAVASRKGVDAAKVRYLSALEDQAEFEWARRPDRIGVA